MYATAEIVLQQHDNVLTLPLTAVINADKQALCCCVEDGKIVRKPITLGLKTAQDVEVADGLKGDEVVVQTEVGSLQDGHARSTWRRRELNAEAEHLPARCPAGFRARRRGGTGPGRTQLWP